MFDVIIVGGSYSGLSAAMQLGRARRSVLVVDAGQRRNRFASNAHGFLGQDGESPRTIAEKGRREVLAYPTVSLREGAVTETRAVEGGFLVRVGDEEHRSRRLILATGISDELPELPGIAERWGKTVFHCPYCHGYELNRGRLGVLATHPMSAHHALLVSEWGPTTLFLNGGSEPDDTELGSLAARKVGIEREPVVAAEGDAPRIGLRLRDGRTIELDGLFLVSRTRLNGPFAEQLGCALDEGPAGSFYKTDPTKETSIPGVFACGDAALMAGSVSFAVADGVMAGIAAHRSLVFRP